MGDIDLTEHIRRRAYEIWQGEGRPHGRHLMHWLRAEAEIRVALKAPAPMEKPPQPASKPPRKNAPSSKPAVKSPQRRPPKG